MRKVPNMGTKKSGLRSNATIVAAGLVLVLLALVLVSNVMGNRPKHLETAKFLSAQFIEGKFLEGFTPGMPEYGFSLEALSQLSAAREIDKSAAIEFLLQTQPDYLLVAETTQLQPGLTGKFLYASKVAGATNRPIVDDLIERISQQISDSGQLNSATASTFDYSWLILGLYAQDQKELAAKLALTLAQTARSDGGFGFDVTEATTESSTDATAMAIMALELTKNTIAETTSQKQAAIDAGLLYLMSNIVEGSHFVAYEAEDVNGTALALMAFHSTEQPNLEPIHRWLESKIEADGGLGSPWVEGVGDKYATAQGYLALEGKSYLDLLGR
jgi:hypothetical protein